MSDDVSGRYTALPAWPLFLAHAWPSRSIGSRSIERLVRLRDRLRDARVIESALLCEVEAKIAERSGAAAPIPRPLHCDWAWRPQAWSRQLRPSGLVAAGPGARFGEEIALFHDCPLAETAMHQGTGERPGAPFCLVIETFGFSGEFLSLAVDLPVQALADLGDRHILTATAEVQFEVPVPTVLRLNLRQGPEVRQITRGLDMGHPVEFDLAAAGLDRRDISAGWLDLIFQAPGANRIAIPDLTMNRRPRAML